MRHALLFFVLAACAPQEAADLRETASEPGGYAVGIDIDVVAMSQAIDVTLFAEGAEVSKEERITPLIAGRDANVRVSWVLDDDFAGRDITAELTLTNPSGAQVLTDTRTIDGPADRDLLDGTFLFAVDGASITDETTLSVALLEADGEGSDTPVRAPATGALELAAWGEPMELSVTLFPCATQCGGPSVAISQQQREITENWLMNLYPVQALSLTWEEEELLLDGCTDTTALDALQAERERRGAGPGEYYHCVLPNSYDSDLAGGYAWILSDAPGEERVSFSVNWWGPDEEMVANVGHELGHNHGRYHPDDDPDYEPAEAATYGCRSSWGLGIRGGPIPIAYWYPELAEPDQIVMPPVDDLSWCEWAEDGVITTGDVMSYTDPHWVDPHTYTAFAERIRTVSAFSARSATEERSVFGTFTDDGIRWHTGRGRLGEVAPDAVWLTLADGTRQRLGVHPRIGSDGAVRGVAFTLPPSARVGERWLGEVRGTFAGHPLALALEDLDR